MAPSDKLPYPPGPDPDDVPDDLADFPPSYVRQERCLLAGLFIFLSTYLTLVLVTGSLAAWLATRVVVAGGLWPVLSVFGAAASAGVFVYLVKGFFKRPPRDDGVHIELTEDDHPPLFAFIRRVCEETGADEPRRVIAVPDVNAGTRLRVTFANLFVPPKKDLVIGLGLVNCLNLGEFQAVAAHELGHSTGGGFLGEYTGVVARVANDLVNGRDWLDDFAAWAKDQGPALRGLGLAVGGTVWLFRAALNGLYRGLAVYRVDVLREQEFHADLVAASVAGTDAVVHGLLKSDFGDRAARFARAELEKAADHGLYTADLYFHQHAAADILRAKEKRPAPGLPPRPDDPLDGKRVHAPGPDAGAAGPADYHPTRLDREENVKSRYVPAPADERSPWLLFDDPVGLRERMTAAVYRAEFDIPRGADLAAPRAVQKFIDDEHRETTYDPRYEGVYDDRMIDPGDPDELNELIRREPWTDDRLAAVYRKLYHDLKGRAEDRGDLQREYDRVQRQSHGGASRRARRLLKDLRQRLDTANEWFHSVDRRAYLVFVQMAYRVHADYYYELVNRYRFHLAIQGMYKSARYHSGRAWFFFNMVASQQQVQPDDFVELMHVLREARSALKKIVREARELDLPAMKNFEEGDRLADFLLDQDIVPELPETYVKGKWIDKLLKQLDQVMRKAARLHFKSLGGILALQEEIAAKFLARAEPVTPEVIEVPAPGGPAGGTQT